MQQVNEESGRRRRVRCNECFDADDHEEDDDDDAVAAAVAAEAADEEKKFANGKKHQQSDAQQSRSGHAVSRSAAVDTSGDGVTDSYFDAERGILCLAFPKDTNGDGFFDHLAVDMSGDGLVSLSRFVPFDRSAVCWFLLVSVHPLANCPCLERTPTDRPTRSSTFSIRYLSPSLLDRWTRRKIPMSLPAPRLLLFQISYA